MPQATVSLLSGGGVGVGDSLDTLDAELVEPSPQGISPQVVATCRTDGRLLSPGTGLTATPLQVPPLPTTPDLLLSLRPPST